MRGYKAFLQGLSQSPNQFYRSNVQEFVNQEFTDTTRLDIIFEENLPFSFEFDTEQEVIVDKVSDNFINLQKVIGDYKSIMFKDCKHKNERGQYIKYDNEYYLVYEKQDKLDTISKCKIIRCNNKIRWYDEDGVIREYPVFIGQEVGSTTPQISKAGITANRRLVVMLQGNKHSLKIKTNDRFVISHKHVFKVNEIGDYEFDNYEQENANICKLYIEWVSANTDDDLENNISKNGDVYSINIIQDTINQVNGFEGKLESIVEVNASPLESIVIYESNDLSIVEVARTGEYRIVGIAGQTAQIKAYIQGNEDVYDIVEVNVVDTPIVDDTIVVSPIFNSLSQYETIVLKADLYLDSVKSNEIVTCVASGSDLASYKLLDTINHNEFSLECIKGDTTPLTLTFTSGLIDKTIEIQLKDFM